MGFRSDLYAGEAFNFETLTVGAAAVPFTPSKYVAPANSIRAEAVLVTVETNSIRYRGDGVAPTATIGHLVTAGNSFMVVGYDNVASMQMIRQSADATIMVTYYH